MELPKVGPDEMGGVFWDMQVRVVDGEVNGVVAQVWWGWTSPDQDLSNYAEDAPRGYDCTFMRLDQLRDFRDRINGVLEQFPPEKFPRAED
jgi:hypothetical protein